MGVIGFHVDEVSPDPNATVLMSRSIVQQPGAHRAFVMPKNSASSCIKGKRIVGRRDIHYAADDNGRYFQPIGIRRMENP